MADRALERELALLAAEVEFPATPELAARVEAAVTTVPRRRRWPRAVPRPLRVALIAVLVLLIAVATALAASRAVRELLGLSGATVERTTLEAPALTPQPLDLGRRVPLRAARRAAPFGVVVPAALGPPDAAYVRYRGSFAEVALSYRARPGLPRAPQLDLGLLVTELRGTVDRPMLGKLVPQATRVEELRVGGHRAIWIEGAPHYVGYRDADGDLRQATLRAAGNVLLVERRGVLVRLEGALMRERAVAIARSLR